MSKPPSVVLTWEEYEALMYAAGLSINSSGISDLKRLLALYQGLENAEDPDDAKVHRETIASFKYRHGG